MAIALCFSFNISTRAADSLVWHTNQNRIDASIESWALPKLLEKISAVTGWQIYLEPGTTYNTSVKFKNLPLGDALHSLLGNLNFALVPQTNASPRLFVFHTSLQEATQLISPAPGSAAAGASAKGIRNELVVTLKPGARIDAIAELLGAKVIGRIDGLNAYRLQFEDEAAAEAARQSLLNNPDVASVDSNYSIDRPTSAQGLLASSVPPLDLKPKAPDNADCHIIVGLLDTVLQPLGNNLDGFLLPSIAVAGDAQTGDSRPTHGTAMAQTLLRSVNAADGSSAAIRILPVDVFGKNPSTSTFDVANGIYKAVNAGANVINLSLGSGGDSTTLHNVIKSASQQGVVFFAAAGNEPVTTPFYPAAYPEVVAVTAGDRKGQIASYANRGDFVDVVAPGSSVVYFKDQPYLVSGTSAAAAFATGLAAGLADANKKCPGDVLPTIRSTLAVKSSTGQ